MRQSFQNTVTSLLPSEERLLARLRELSKTDVQSILDFFSVNLPEFDVVIGMPTGSVLAEGLANLRGTPLVMAEPHEDGSDLWTLGELFAQDIQTAVIVTNQFDSALNEMKVVVQAAQRGWLVVALAAAVERTNRRGRARIELQGVQVKSVVQLADTPRGLEPERRFPQGH